MLPGVGPWACVCGRCGRPPASVGREMEVTPLINDQSGACPGRKGLEGDGERARNEGREGEICEDAKERLMIGEGRRGRAVDVCGSVQIKSAEENELI